jgi:cytochrome c
VSAPLALLGSSGCTACHAVKTRVIGPAFQEIATKYKGKPNLDSYLAGKIRSGGNGLWGAIPMPAQAQLKDADVKTIAAWLAAGAK